MLHSLKNLFRHRALLRALTAREVSARYRGSILGFLWSLLNPLLLLLVYTFVFRYLFVPARGSGPQPFGVFLFTGILVWTWFSGALLEASWSIIHGGGLLRKVSFPAEILPLVPVLSNAFHFIVALPVLMVILVLFGHIPGLNALAVIPIFLIQLVMTSGIALVIAALSVLFRDVPQLLNHLLTFGFFATPIIYVISAVPEAYRAAILLNPVTHIVTGWQDALFFDRPVHWQGIGIAAFVAVVVAVVGYAFFDRLREVLPEEV